MMAFLTKLLGLVAFGKGITEKLIFKRFITHLTTAIALTIISAMMVGVLLFGILFIIYRICINFDLTPDAALLITGLIALTITGLVIYKTVTLVKGLFDLPKQISAEDLPLPTRMAYQASNVIESFAEGVMTGKGFKNRNRSRY